MKNLFGLKKITLYALALWYLASSSVANAAEFKGKVLVVMSSAKILELKGGKSVPIGYYLGELAIPAQSLIDEGYTVVIATPDGKKPTMDRNSNKVSLFNNDQEELNKALKFVNNYPPLKKPKKLSHVLENLDEYVGIFVPGGHAPMADLIKDANLGAALHHFHKESKPTALLCHGPAALISAMPSAAAYVKALAQNNEDNIKKTSKGWQYDGYELTVISNDEEKQAQHENLKGELKFFASDALEKAGADVKNGDDGKSFVIADRELITGQNYNSTAELTSDFIKALDDRADLEEEKNE